MKKNIKRTLKGAKSPAQALQPPPPDRSAPQPDASADAESLIAYDVWLANVGEEIRYWRNYINTDGGDYPEDFVFRCRTDTLIADRNAVLADLLRHLPAQAIRILDVGAGPITNLGKLLPGKSIEIVPCDPLADVYRHLWQENGRRPPIGTIFADAENLSCYLRPGSFDAVHCANALDHSHDPTAGIVEMLKMLSPAGFVHLRHMENEAERELYRGLHQWNFTEREGDFVIWNRTREVSLRGFLGGHAFLAVERITRAVDGRALILVTIRRNELTEGFVSSRAMSLPGRYRRALDTIFRGKLAAL